MAPLRPTTQPDTQATITTAPDTSDKTSTQPVSATPYLTTPSGLEGMSTYELSPKHNTRSISQFSADPLKKEQDKRMSPYRGRHRDRQSEREEVRYRSRSRSPRDSRDSNYSVGELSRQLPQTSLINVQKTTASVAARSKSFLEPLTDLQENMRNPLFSMGLALIATAQDANGDMARTFLQYQVGNSVSAFMDIREVMKETLHISHEEAEHLLKGHQMFAVLITANDIKIFEYPADLLTTPDQIRQDYVKNNGQNLSQPITVTGHDLLELIFPILLAKTDKNLVQQSLHGNISELQQANSLSAKTTLLCLCGSVEVLEEIDGVTFWEIWPECKVKWPFSTEKTKEAQAYLKEYFKLLLDGHYEQAKVKYDNMDNQFGEGCSILDELMTNLSVATQKNI